LKPWVVGIDAGGTKTEAWAVAADGEIVARATCGAGNPLTVGFDHAAGVVMEALAAVSLSRTEPSLVCIGMAGVGRPPERNRMVAALKAKGLPREGWDCDPAQFISGEVTIHPQAGAALLDHDAMIALAAVTNGGPGVAVIAGTGSIAFAVDESGKRLRSGGWGHLYDDRGSAFWIGSETLGAVCQAYDGRGPATGLVDAVCLALRAKDLPGVTSHLLCHENPKAAIASVAPVCGDAAEAGDAVAQHIIEQAGEELALMAAAVVNAGAFAHRPVAVGLQGGAFANVKGLRQALEHSLAKREVAAHVQDSPLPPVAGAALLSMKALGWTLPKIEWRDA